MKRITIKRTDEQVTSIIMLGEGKKILDVVLLIADDVKMVAGDEVGIGITVETGSII